MNVGALALIAVLSPPGLSILFVGNGHYGETGYQEIHTSLGIDLQKNAAGCAIRRTGKVSDGADPANRRACCARGTACSRSNSMIRRLATPL